jgi:hypothetical protein
MLRPRRGDPTPVDRTEAFSDGVFGVAITLLALDLARIHADPPDTTLSQALRADELPRSQADARNELAAGGDRRAGSGPESPPQGVPQ